MRVSVAVKIISIAVIVIIAMAVVSVINLFTARNVTSGIERITTGYLNIYGATARINVYSIEEAYRVRRYIIDKTLGLRPDSGGADLAATQARLNKLEGLVADNIALARKTTASELANPDSLVDQATLARIDERLSWIERAEKENQDRLQAMMTALQGNDMARFREDFDDLTKWRIDFDDYMDTTRQEVFAAATDAGRQVTLHQARAMRFSVTLLALACVLALGTAILLARHLVRPLRELLVGMRSITSGSLDVEVPVKSRDEVGRLTEAFNQMIHELRIGVRARQLFGTYVDVHIARQLIEVPQSLGQEGERRKMTVMFCDLQGFTSLSEQMTPRGLVAVMNRYFTLMSEVVRAHEGIIDKFIGDAVMAYWGPPFVAEADQETLAAKSALAQLERMTQLQAELPDLMSIKSGAPAAKVRIGIATGDVLVGTIGSDFMRNFTVMGDAVNVASRLDSANKIYGTTILLTEETAHRVGGDIELREIDSLIVTGQTHPIRIFEVIGRAGQLSDAQRTARDFFAGGLAAYRHQDWDAAESAFAHALGQTPDDPAAKMFVQRIADLRRHPPPADWDGAWTMETK
ncbi:MAG TPA: adenylate/guanylate cyclase domain-containing protein [Stellaceae bacterium]|nr:adenylate/guanylate cyclase domain-containing protein [Stellaceae bacterium]